MLRSAYPPGGDPLDFPDTPPGAWVVDVAELAHKPMPAWGASHYCRPGARTRPG